MNLNHCFLINYTKRTINSLKLKKNRPKLIRLFFRLIIKNNYVSFISSTHSSNVWNPLPYERE